MESLKLGLKPLSLEDVRDVAVHGRRVELSPQAVKKIEKAHQFLQAQIKKGETLYGVNTGFGLMSNVKIPPVDIEQLQYNLLRSHACGVGPSLSDEHARAMLLLRAANLAIGHSGVSLALVEHILTVLNRGIVPLIPSRDRSARAEIWRRFRIWRWF